MHHALHISIFYFSCLLHVGGGQGTLRVLVKNVMWLVHHHPQRSTLCTIQIQIPNPIRTSPPNESSSVSYVRLSNLQAVSFGL
jgi:hypothetical protein